MSEQAPDTGGPDDEGLEGEDFYMDGPYMVFTAAYHLKRGYCCSSGCRHCPYRDAPPGEPAKPGS
ncbi:MAG TPA: DUF5522 domain-containing protein [Acidobacteriaceae bacterium]